MLAFVVFPYKRSLQARRIWSDLPCQEGHLCYCFKYCTVINSFVRRRSPGKRGVIPNQNHPHLSIIQIPLLETVDYLETRFVLIVSGDYFIVHRRSAWNVAGEMISMCRTEDWDIELRLRPRRSIGRMCMNDAPRF